MKTRPVFKYLAICHLLFASSRCVLAQATDVTYQGRLNDGTNSANGIYDLRFALFDSTNKPGVLLAGPVTNMATAITNGLFTVTLNFPPGSFQTPDTWLEAAVRTNGGSAFATLAPRQKVTPTPYALYALDAANANLANNVYPNTILQAQALQVGVNNFISTSSASVAGGMNNIADGAYTSIAGGFQNTAGGGDSIFIGGGSANYASGDRAVVCGGENNAANGDHSFIGGGGWNSTGAYDAVSGGFHNTVSADKSGIGSGYGNTVSGYASWIGGGQENDAANDFCVIGGGVWNTNLPLYGTISGGQYNIIEEFADFGTIAGGGGNQIIWGAESSAIVGGYENVIGSNSAYCAVGGGNRNKIDAYTPNSIIGGGWLNHIDEDSYSSIIGGGQSNSIDRDAPFNTIAGGDENEIRAASTGSVIAGGSGNRVEAYAGTIAGGGGNMVLANSTYGTIGGGYGNVVDSNSVYATIPGGDGNSATNYAFAAGRLAKAEHSGAFVWADSQDTPFTSTRDDEFCIRAQGGVQLSPGTDFHWSSDSALLDNQGGAIELGDSNGSRNTPFIDFHFGIASPQDFNVRIINDADEELSIQRASSTTPMAIFNAGGLTVNGTFVNSSDRNQKENFQPVNISEVLARVAALPLSKWNYKADKKSTHLGPMAQDFYAAFQVGPDDKHIATVDADGVALAAIQGLNQKLETMRAENAGLKARLDRLEKLLGKINGGGQ
ncbi:MAG TPA: tail fiber domain-containing protein [Candidatus Acidoferrum sp.]|nr:tail fiber domain-containing protein [Candidatus Acidoferrum sp.]